MGGSKDFPIIDHEYVPCGCGDPDCPYCAECHEQKCFHQRVEVVNDGVCLSGIRDVSIDEVFTWGDEFGLRAREAFGGWRVDCSPQTFSDLKDRCEREDRKADPFFEHICSLIPVPLNGISVHMVKVGELPDGVLRRCQCGKGKKSDV